MTDRELMQQALEALNHVNVQDRLQIITALRERLAQSEQEPVAWANKDDLQNFDMRVRTNCDLMHTVPLYTTPPQRKPEQALVIDCPRCGHCCSQKDPMPLFDDWGKDWK